MLLLVAPRVESFGFFARASRGGFISHAGTELAIFSRTGHTLSLHCAAIATFFRDAPVMPFFSVASVFNYDASG